MRYWIALAACGLAGLATVRAAVVELDGAAATGVRLLAQDGARSVLECTVAAFETRERLVDGQPWQEVLLPGEPTSLEAGAPALPFLAAALALPDRGATALRVLEEDWSEFPLAVLPSKGNLTRDVDPATVPWSFGPVYQQGLVWPQASAELDQPYVLRDVRGQTVRFRPFRYDAARGVLQVASRMVVEVDGAPGAGLNELDRATPPAVLDRDFARLYEQRFLNWGAAQRYAALEEQGRMLVICPDAFLATVQPFVDWKRQLGFEVDLQPLSAVGSTAAAIQAYVEDYYIAPGLAWLQLVGDAEQLPSLSAAGGSSDPGYAMLAGGDYYPDIFVGRFSASTVADLQTQVERVVEYERDPEAGGAWYARGTGIGSAEGAGIGDDGEADTVHQSNIRTDLLGFTYTLVDQIYDPGATASQVSAALDAGRSILTYTGHGSTTAWSTTGFSNTQVNALTNANRLPFIIDVACVNGQFAGTTCFAEAWMRATSGGEPAGAVGIWASTINQSWAPPMAAQDECVDLLVSGARTTFGGLCFNGAMRMNDEYADYDMTRTWTIFGDPSLVVRTAAPQALAVVHAASLLSTAPTFAVQTGAPGSRAALTGDGALYGLGFADGAGSVLLELVQQPPVGATLTLTVTGFNLETYVGAVEVIPPAGPYVSLAASALDGDGLLGPLEATTLEVVIENLGVETAAGLQLTLACADPRITLADASEAVGDLAAGAQRTLPGAFALETGALADGESIAFELLAEDGSGGSWTTPFALTAAAPVLRLAGVGVLDGGNGRLDPGESAALELTLVNDGGLDAGPLTLELASLFAGLTVVDGPLELAGPSAGGSIAAGFGVAVDGEVPVGAAADLALHAGGALVDETLPFALTIGLTLEDFESGTFSAYPWEGAGNLPWTIDGAAPHGGAWCARSGSIGHSQSSELRLAVDVLAAGEIRFWRRVSSESGYDYLRFYLDGVQQGQWSGEQDWAEIACAVSAGEHVFRWVYQKDVSVVGGSDAAWIDDIVFPSLAPPALPRLALDAAGLAFAAAPGGTDAGALTATNAGTAPLELSFAFVAQAAPPARSMEGSTLSAAEGAFEAGGPLTLHLTLTNGSPDDEWAQAATLDLPPGAVVVSASALVVSGQARELSWDGAAGDGATTGWIDADGGWGNVFPGESAVGTLELDLAAGFAGDLDLPWTISGDVYGADPHIVSGSLALVNEGEIVPSWLRLEAATASVAPGQSFELGLIADAATLPEGVHAGELRVASNDPLAPLTVLPVVFVVGGALDAPALTIAYLSTCDSRLEWTTVPGAAGYRVQQADALVGPWSTIADTPETFWLLPCAMSTTKIYRVVAHSAE